MAYVSPGERRRREDAGRKAAAQHQHDERVAGSQMVLDLVRQLRDAGCPRSFYVENTIVLTPRQARRWPEDCRSERRDPGRPGAPPVIYGVSKVVRGWLIDRAIKRFVPASEWSKAYDTYSAAIITEESMIVQDSPYEEKGLGWPRPGTICTRREDTFNPISSDLRLDDYGRPDWPAIADGLAKILLHPSESG